MIVLVGSNITEESLASCPVGSALTIYEYNTGTRCLTVAVRDVNNKWLFQSSPHSDRPSFGGALDDMSWIVKDQHVKPLALFIPEGGDIK